MPVHHSGDKTRKTEKEIKPNCLFDGSQNLARY